MTKSKVQIAIILLGLLSYGLGVKTMLQTPTMILPPWFLVLIFSPFVFGISIGLGFATKAIIKSKLHWATFSSIFIAIISWAFFFKEYRYYDKVKVQLDEHKSGHYFIISTTDKSRISSFNNTPLSFDNNNVIYLDSGLYNHCEIIPINNNKDDLSKRIKNFMGNEFYLIFYNPSDEEYKTHPDWDEYYLNKDNFGALKKLTSLGYIVEDSTLIKK